MLDDEKTLNNDEVDRVLDSEVYDNEDIFKQFFGFFWWH